MHDIAGQALFDLHRLNSSRHSVRLRPATVPWPFRQCQEAKHALAQ